MLKVFMLAFVTTLLIPCNCLTNPPHRESNNPGLLNSRDSLQEEANLEHKIIDGNTSDRMLSAIRLLDYACPSGWTQYNSNCYKFAVATVTWSSCQSTCAGLNAMMLCVTDAETNAWMWGMTGGKETWIGLSDIGHFGTYTWVPGCPSTYTNWDNGQPDNLGTQNYAYIWSGQTSSGKWDNREGGYSAPCACQYKPLCPSGWTYYNNKCYKFAVATGTWSSCQSTCAGLNAMMLCVTDADTNAWVWSMTGGKDTWIGLSDIGHFGTYTWVPGCSSPYTNWDGGQPDNLGTQNYAYIWSGHNGKWDNREGGFSAPCACQYDIAPSSTPTTAPSTTTPSTAVPTIFPTTSPSTVTPSTSTPSISPSILSSSVVIPNLPRLPTCPEGWTLHSTCEWTYGGKHLYQEASPASATDDSFQFSAVIAIAGFLTGMMVMGLFTAFCILPSKDSARRAEYMPINESG